MQKTIWSRIRLGMAAVILLLGIFIIMWKPTSAQAAEQPVSITSCKLNSSGSKLTVKAKVKKKTSAMGKKLYLLNLNAYNSESGKKSATPLTSVKTKKGTITFKVKYKSSMLYQKFVVAYKTGGKYQVVSDARYITNPEILASYKGKGPTTTSKKGLQVEELSDSLEIGTQHAVVNWTLNSLLNNNAINKTTFQYKGKTYYLDADQLQRNDELVQAYNAAGVRVTVILLLPKDAASTGTTSMQYGGYAYTKFSSFKTSSKTACNTFEAVMTYLASRYGTKENLVSGWILGNEVNSACIWNYGGNKSLSSYMTNYARAFRICYNAVKSVSKYSKVYISLDNNWNRDIDGSSNRYFSSKAVLDKFYAKLKEQGKISFQIAYHAYPQGMSDPIFWDDSWATNSVNAKIINFKNLKVLTNYAKKNFGKNCTIMLSEQSFNSSRGEIVQAAAYAYAYYLSETNSMIESFIYGREFDHPDETKDGYNWGLCDNWHSKRLIWSVFQYIDTKDSFKFTDPLVKYTNLKKWTKISGFKRSKFTGMASKRKKATITGIESASTTELTITWEQLNTGDGYEIFRNGVMIDSVAGNSTVTYTDKNLVQGGTYQYQVRMYKEAPDASNANSRVRLYGTISDVVTATVTAGQVKLNEEKCAVSGNEITVAWKKLSDVSGYEIYRSTAIDGDYILIGTAAGTKTTYKDSQTLSGTTYYYKVRAFITLNGTNYYGSFSDTTEKQALIQLTGTIVGDKIVFNWTQWQSATKYRVYGTTEADNSFVRMKTLDGFTYSCSKYRDPSETSVDFAVGETYLFRVRADFGDGTYSKYSNIITITFQPNEEVNPTGMEDEQPNDEDTGTSAETETAEPTTETEATVTETVEPTTETETAGTETVEPTTETEAAETETIEPTTETEAAETETIEPATETETDETETMEPTTETEATETGSGSAELETSEAAEAGVPETPAEYL